MSIADDLALDYSEVPALLPPERQVIERLIQAERRIVALEAQVKDLANRVDAARRIAIDARDAADPRHYGGDGH